MAGAVYNRQLTAVAGSYLPKLCWADWKLIDTPERTKKDPDSINVEPELIMSGSLVHREYETVPIYGSWLRFSLSSPGDGFEYSTLGKVKGLADPQVLEM